MSAELRSFTPYETQPDEAVTTPDAKAFDDRKTDEPALQDVLRQLPEQLESRVENAIDTCEFTPTPEIEHAMKGYYVDHYRTAAVVERLIAGEQIDPAILTDEATMLESFELTEGLSRLAQENNRYKQLQDIQDFIGTKLFRESAVGQTTVGDDELQTVVVLNNALHLQVASENAFIASQYTNDELTDGIMKAKQLFWQDSRAAGQLEFHNTPFADQVAESNFHLRTKTNQAEASGDYNSVTADVQNHSQSVHFSETFLSDSYKRVQLGNSVDHVTVGGTIAIPLAEIVKQLPYARGGEYGVLTLRQDAKGEPTVIDDANIYAFGGSHVAGGADDHPSERGEDRTFYADKYDRKKAENYAIDFGRGMSQDGITPAKVLFLQRDIDMAHRKQYLHNGESVDMLLDFGTGEGYPEVQILDFDYGRESFLGHAREMEAGKPFVEQAQREQSANNLGLYDPRLDRVATDQHSYRVGVTPEQQEQELRKAIGDMQRESRESPHYRGKIVAMLRGGTMAFRPSA